MARGDPTWHTSSTGPDVDAELEGGRGHQGPQVPGPQAVLHPLAAVLRQAAVVGGHLVGPEPLGQEVGQALGHPPGVDEDEGGPVARARGRRCGR